MNQLKKLITLARISRTTSLAFATLLGAVGFASMTPPVSAQAVNFGSVNVCAPGKTTPTPCSGNKTVTFSIPADTTISKIAIVTTGTPNLDFKAKAADSSTTLCKAKSYSAATTCTVDVTFTPLAPGARNGAVQLVDGSKVLATKLIYGTGIGPQVAFGPGTQIMLPFGDLSDATGIAVDAAGNVFIAEGLNSVVLELPAGGSAPITLPFNNLQEPIAVAVDGAGDVFVTQTFNSQIAELPAGSTTQVTLPFQGLASPDGLVVDGAGNVFVADSGNGRVVELPAGGGAQVTIPLSGLNSPAGLALDATGDLFVADSGNHRVLELPAGSGTQVTLPFTGSAIGPFVAVDPAGDVFASSDIQVPYNNRQTANAGVILELPANGGPQITLPFTPSAYVYFSMALDANGNLFAGEIAGLEVPFGEVVELQRSVPPAFAFPNTLVGSDSPLSTTLLSNWE